MVENEGRSETSGDQIVHGLMSHLEHFGFHSVRYKPLEGFKPRMTWPDVDLTKSTLGIGNTLRRTRDEGEKQVRKLWERDGDLDQAVEM